MIELETLPKGWTIAKLEEVCEMYQPHTISTKQLKPYGKYLVYGANGIIGRYDKYNHEHSELLVTCRGASCGSVNISKPYSWINGNAMVIRPFDPNLLSLNFIEMFFRGGFNVKNAISGSAQPQITRTSLNPLEIPIPPINEQTRILAKLEQLLTDLDKGIEYLETTKQQLKVYRQAVLKWAFEGRLNRDSSDYDDKHDLNNKNKKNQGNHTNQKNQGSDKGELPNGWTKTTLGKIVRKVSVKALPTEMPESKFIGMDCIEPNALKPFMTYQFNQFKSAGNSFKVNHVLYGRMRPYLNKVYKAEFDGVCSGEFIIMECLNDFNPELLKYILHQRDFVRFANQKTSGDRPRVSFEELAEYPIFKCSPVEQNLIVQEIESRLSVCDKIEETIESSLQQTEVLRLSIIKKAFEGKLVPQDPNDEPAEKLLERIRALRQSSTRLTSRAQGKQGNGKTEKKEKTVKL